MHLLVSEQYIDGFFLKTILMTEIQCELWVGLSCTEETTTADFREHRDGTSGSRQTNNVLMV